MQIAITRGPAALCVTIAAIRAGQPPPFRLRFGSYGRKHQGRDHWRLRARRALLRQTQGTRHEVDTPFGRPSDAVMETRRAGSVFFLSRHGPGHVFGPSQVPRANVSPSAASAART